MTIVRLPRAVGVQVYVEFAADDRSDEELVRYVLDRVTCSVSLNQFAPAMAAGIVPVRPKGPTP